VSPFPSPLFFAHPPPSPLQEEERIQRDLTTVQAAVTEARARLSALQDKVDAAEAACKESKTTMARVQEAQKQVGTQLVVPARACP
jgi:hypothetical protein